MNRTQVREFRRVLRQFTRVTNSQLRQCCSSVTLAQCLVLLEVDEERRLSVGQLASKLRLDDSTLSRTIDGLVRRGLLQRSRDDQDRRIVWIDLTPEGTAECAKIHDRNDDLYGAILDGIPASSRDEVVRHFKILVQVFLDQEDEPGTRRTCRTGEEVHR
jgi:DNA-binding MarR family transcriptional regulator